MLNRLESRAGNILREIFIIYPDHVTFCFGLSTLKIPKTASSNVFHNCAICKPNRAYPVNISSVTFPLTRRSWYTCGIN